MRVKTFKALGILLWYPNTKWLSNVIDLYELMIQEAIIKESTSNLLHTFVERLRTRDIFELQEDYVNTFDRTPSLSLYLFEHVHGESRERGQAMIDLMNRYNEQGFSLAVNELPDYLPVFLEYLSLLPVKLALEELSNITHILMVLYKRLAECGSSYNIVFDIMIRLIGREVPKVVTSKQALKPDLVEIDQAWEEEPVNFLMAKTPQFNRCQDNECNDNCNNTLSLSKKNITQEIRS